MVFKMESDKKILKRYKIIKFEDLILNPNGSIEKLYELTGLSSKFLKKIRLKEKSYTGKHEIISYHQKIILIAGMI